MGLETLDQTNNGIGPRVRRIMPVHKNIRAISIFGNTEAETRANQADKGLQLASVIGAPTIDATFATFAGANHLTLPIDEPEEMTIYLAFRAPSTADLNGADRALLAGWFDGSAAVPGVGLVIQGDAGLRVVGNWLDGASANQSGLLNIGMPAGAMKSGWQLISLGIRKTVGGVAGVIDGKNHITAGVASVALNTAWNRNRAPAGRPFRWGAGLSTFTGASMQAYGVLADTYHTIAERDVNAAAMRGYLNEVRGLGVL